MTARVPAFWLVVVAVACVVVAVQLAMARVRARRWASEQRARLARQRRTQT